MVNARFSTDMITMNARATGILVRVFNSVWAHTTNASGNSRRLYRIEHDTASIVFGQRLCTSL